MEIKYEISFYLFTTLLLLSWAIFAEKATATFPDEPIIPPIPPPQLEKPQKIPLLKLPQNDTGSVIIPKGIPFIPQGSVYVVWHENELLFKMSTDGGKTFTPPVAMSISNNLADRLPAVISSKNTIYIIWMSHDAGGNTDIFLKKSIDGGKTFAPEKQINISNIPGSNIYNVATDSSNNLYVVWYGKGVPPTGEILLKKSTDGGKTFGSQIQIMKLVTESDGHHPEIALDSKDRVYIAWDDSPSKDGEPWDILLKKSSDGGKTFAPQEPINISNTPDKSRQQSIAAR